MYPENVPLVVMQSSGDSYEHYGDMDNSLEIEEEADPINIWNSHMDLLDAIEQQYEREHRELQEKNSSMQTEPSSSLKAESDKIEDPE